MDGSDENFQCCFFFFKTNREDPRISVYSETGNEAMHFWFFVREERFRNIFKKRFKLNVYKHSDFFSQTFFVFILSEFVPLARQHSNSHRKPPKWEVFLKIKMSKNLIKSTPN